MNAQELLELKLLLQKAEIAAYVVRTHIMDLNFKTDSEREIMYKGLDKAINHLVKVRNAVMTEQQKEDEALAMDVYI